MLCQVHKRLNGWKMPCATTHTLLAYHISWKPPCARLCAHRRAQLADPDDLDAAGAANADGLVNVAAQCSTAAAAAFMCVWGQLHSMLGGAFTILPPCLNLCRQIWAQPVRDRQASGCGAAGRHEDRRPGVQSVRSACYLILVSSRVLLDSRCLTVSSRT